MFYNVDYFQCGYTKHLIWDLVNLMDFVLNIWMSRSVRGITVMISDRTFGCG